MAPIHHQTYNALDQLLFIKASRGDARARPSIPSPLSIYSTSAEIITYSPPELATHIEPRAPRKATVHHAARQFRQSVQPQGGQLRVANSNPYPRVMASDHDPRYFPFYSGVSSVEQAHDVRSPSRGNTGISQNMLRGQAYQAYAPKPSFDRLVRALDYYRTQGCLNHGQRPDNHTSRAHRQYYSDPDLNADRAAIRGFPILADNYQLERRPHVKVKRPNHENSHPHVLRMGELKHRHSSMAVSEAITEPELTGRARLQQSFETRRRAREPRSTIH